MNVEEFKDKLKSCKRSLNMTSHYDLKVRVNQARNEWYIYARPVKCGKCGHVSTEGDGIRLCLKEPKKNLTIFEAGLFYMMYILSLRPHDYGDWHKCIAGQRFINNIDKIKI